MRSRTDRLRLTARLGVALVAMVGVCTSSAPAGTLLVDFTAGTPQSGFTGQGNSDETYIIDTGLTLNYITEYLRGKDPASLGICTLLDKPARRLVEIDLKYRGFTIPDRFVIGYGLDYDEIYRNLPYIGVLKPEVYGGT